MNKIKDRFVNNFRIFNSLTMRHLKVFFNNKIRVFYTLMVPVIILFVYILFLKDLELNAIKNELFKMNIEQTEELIKLISTVVDAWMLSGIIVVSNITISLQTNNIIVEDKDSGVNRDFIASPISKKILISSYFFYNFIITFGLCIIVLFINYIYLGIVGNFYVGFVDFSLMFSTLFFISIVSTLVTVFITLFIKNEPTLSSIVTIFSTAIGFLTGAYMPISMFPKFVQYTCAFFPTTYSCSLMRFAFLNTPLSNLERYLKVNPSILPPNSSAIDVVNIIRNSYGYNVDFFGINIDPTISAVITTAFVIVFAILNLLFASNITRMEGPIKIGAIKYKIKESKKLSK